MNYLMARHIGNESKGGSLTHPKVFAGLDFMSLRTVPRLTQGKRKSGGISGVEPIKQ